ncbi:MAG: HEAT repeat domain-containing protein [Myxococcales bacterium]|nr:HEAT repeat domain-containing protein [Myxococcales bacterium]MDP3504548.1 HEAT repeat domain-containing protein [Myxococcales bacterium]
MRFVSLGVLCASTVLAADARVTLLAKQLTTTKDPRVRSQTVLLLGQTQSDDAVAPLCASLKDPESIVRSAAASALGELHTEAAIDCLKAGLGESDPGVRAALQRAISSTAVTRGSLYLNVEPTADTEGGLDSRLVSLAHETLTKQLTTLGAAFAPAGEEKKAAQALIKARALRGFQVRMQLGPGATEKQLKVEMLIMTYPDQALQGSWNVKASGGKPEALIKAMVPKVVEDAAGDLNWKTP